MSDHKHEARRITIDPVTRLEGHGKIDIFLDSQGEVERALYQVPELRGFEAFCVGRPAEEMPQITSRICGVCPTAHHMAATKALDDLYGVQPPPTAVKIRELVYHAFMLEDHALHVYVLGGPDLLVGPDAPKEQRNIAGVLQTLGMEAGRRMIGLRRRLRELIACVGGKAIHPVMGLPGGVAKGIAPDDLPAFRALGKDALEFALSTLQLFKEKVFENAAYRALLTSDAYTHRTHSMGMVDARNRLNFYDGSIRIVNPEGREIAKFPAQAYQAWVSERVEPWSYAKFCYLKPLGWKGFVEGPESGVYAVAPLARLNAADGLATPQAQQAYEEFYEILGPRPVHYTLANHWARIIEMVYAAERMNALLGDPEITGGDLRVLPAAAPSVGVGIVEAPRGTLIHHYETDEDGLIRECNLIVATQHNAARITMSVEKAAKELIHNGDVNEGLLNRIEMAFRAYDPCNACATHALPGEMPLVVRVYDSAGRLAQELQR